MPADLHTLPACDSSARLSPEYRVAVLLAFSLPLAALGAQFTQRIDPLLTGAALLPPAILLLLRSVPFQNLVGAATVITVIAFLFAFTTGFPILTAAVLFLAAVLTGRAAAESLVPIKMPRTNKTGRALGFSLLPLLLWMPSTHSGMGRIASVVLITILTTLAIVMTVPWFISKRVRTTPPSRFGLLLWLILMISAAEARLQTS